VQELDRQTQRGKRYDVEVRLDEPFKLLKRRWILIVRSGLQEAGARPNDLVEVETGVYTNEEYSPMMSLPIVEIKPLAIWHGRRRVRP